MASPSYCELLTFQNTSHLRSRWCCVYGADYYEGNVNIHFDHTTAKLLFNYLYGVVKYIGGRRLVSAISVLPLQQPMALHFAALKNSISHRCYVCKKDGALPQKGKTVLWEQNCAHVQLRMPLIARLNKMMFRLTQKLKTDKTLKIQMFQCSKNLYSQKLTFNYVFPIGRESPA